ncbi:MAG: F-type H+-transporting ATPase subunit epsilon [Actinomycetota bacterium]|jgi:F-type H+-transporting ATPase subunit epsilon|nr:F-type H+-transporting ATPase subunit epsilon [Actinomycetota bacterium]
MDVEVVSPERILYSGEATMVVCRTTDGEIAFLNNHAPLIGLLGIGPVRVYEGDRLVERVAVHGGFVEVSNNKVTILSDVAELADQIDARRAEEAKARAEADLARLPADEQADAQAALRRAEVRLELTRAA